MSKGIIRPRVVYTGEHVVNQMHPPESLVCDQGDWGRFHDVKRVSVMSVENSEFVISRRLDDNQDGDWRLDTVSRPQNRLGERHPVTPYED